VKQKGQPVFLLAVSGGQQTLLEHVATATDMLIPSVRNESFCHQQLIMVIVSADLNLFLSQT